MADEFLALRGDMSKLFDEIKETRRDIANIDKKVSLIEQSVKRDVDELKKRVDEHDRWHLNQKEKIVCRIWDLSIRIIPPAILLAIVSLIAWGKMKLGWDVK